MPVSVFVHSVNVYIEPVLSDLCTCPCQKEPYAVELDLTGGTIVAESTSKYFIKGHVPTKINKAAFKMI